MVFYNNKNFLKARQDNSNMTLHLASHEKDAPRLRDPVICKTGTTGTCKKIADLCTHIREKFIHDDCGKLYGETKHMAFIVHKDQIMTCGTNYIVGPRDARILSVHAEVCALRKAIKHPKIEIAKSRNYTLIVLRITRTGVLGNSRPCRDCITSISKSALNIRNVYYSTSDGNITSERVDEMADSPLTRPSSGRAPAEWRDKVIMVEITMRDDSIVSVHSHIVGEESPKACKHHKT